MGDEVTEGILQEVVALNWIFQNEMKLARDGEGSRESIFIAEGM